PRTSSARSSLWKSSAPGPVATSSRRIPRCSTKTRISPPSNPHHDGPGEFGDRPRLAEPSRGAGRPEPRPSRPRPSHTAFPDPTRPNQTVPKISRGDGTMPSEATISVQSNGHTLTLPTLAFQGLPSTLCKGCGHNSITSYLIEACKSIGVDPYSTVKLSGIGCSSKTPAYFLQAS